MLVLKYHLTEEEFFDYNFFTAWASPDKKGYRLRYYLRVFLLYGVIAAAYVFLNHSHQLVVDVVIFGVIATVYFLLVPSLIKRSIRRQVTNMLQMPENEHVLEEAEVVLSDTGIVDKDKASENKYTWEAIVRKAETPKAWYLYTNSFHAILIPKRVIVHPSDKAELERLFNTYLPLSSEFPLEN